MKICLKWKTSSDIIYETDVSAACANVADMVYYVRISRQSSLQTFKISLIEVSTVNGLIYSGKVCVIYIPLSVFSKYFMTIKDTQNLPVVAYRWMRISTAYRV